MGHMNALSLMFFAFALRFFLYSVIRNPVWVLPVELLNGVTFAMAYSAAVSYAADLAPVGAEGTLQGIVGTAYMGLGSYKRLSTATVLLIDSTPHLQYSIVFTY